MMLLSYINTQLRDFYPSLEELSSGLGIDQTEVVEKLRAIDYEYDAALNKFV